MKGKKLLAGMLSAAMVLGTMVMPAFAEATTVSDWSSLKTAIEQKKPEIKFGDTIQVTTGTGTGCLANINWNCTIDLNGYDLDYTRMYGDAIYINANVTIKGGTKTDGTNSKVIFDKVSTDVLRIYSGILTVDNVTFEGNGSSWSVLHPHGGDLNLNKVTFNGYNGTDASLYTPFIVDDSTTATIKIKDSNISMGNSSRRVFQNGTYIIQGNSSITGAKNWTAKVYATDDVTLSGITKTAMKVYIKSSTDDITPYDTFDQAHAAATAGDTIVLGADAEWKNSISNAVTVDLNGKTLELKSNNMMIYADTTFRNGKIEVKNQTAIGQGILWTNGGNLTFEGVNFTATNCGDGAAIIQSNTGKFVTKAYNGTKTVMRANDTITYGSVFQAEAHPNAGIYLEDTEIYGDNTSSVLTNVNSIKNCKIELKNVDGHGIANTVRDVEIEGTSIEIDNCEYGAKFYDDCEKKINLTNGSTFTVTNSKKGDIFIPDSLNIDNANVFADSTSTINASVVRTPAGRFDICAYTDWTGYKRIWGEVSGIKAYKSFEIELYAGEELLGKTSLHEDHFNDGTVTYGFNFDKNSTTGTDAWDTPYFTSTPTIEKKPTKVVLYIDGNKMGEAEVRMNKPDNIDSTEWNEIEEVYAPAKIGNVGYTSLSAALRAAQDGDEVTMYEDATMDFDWSLDAAVTLNLNNKTLYMPDLQTSNEAQYYFNKNTTFKGGNIEITGKTATTAALFVYENNVTLTLDDVDLTAPNFGQDGSSACYLIGSLYNNQKIDIINGSTITFKPDTEADVSAIIGLNSPVNIVNSTIDVANISGHAIITNGDGNTLTIKTEGETGETKVLIDGGYSGIFVNGTDSIDIDGTAYVEIKNITGGRHNSEKAGIVLDVDSGYDAEDTATVRAKIYQKATDSNLTDSISVSFKDITAEDAERQKVYEIYLEADDNKTINRLTTAQMKLNLVSEDAFDVLVDGTDEIDVSLVNGDYLFNFNGLTASGATSPKVKIGTITINGSGTFSLTVSDGEAHATTIDGENVVTDFVANPNSENANEGLFDCGTGLEEITIAEATRKLTVKIAFPNKVDDNVSAYQEMQVKIGDETIALGSDVNAMDANGMYVIERDLAFGKRFAVEVSGGGYRTANHMVTMSDDKTLNFWNNYKNDGAEVEENMTTSVKNATFLAGDIVKDSKINIYDLSAVVSYFGTTTNTSNASEYAKFDLDRNGVIDSRDVAYVLVSWEK